MSTRMSNGPSITRDRGDVSKRQASRFFSPANGDHFAGCSGRDGRAAGGDGHLWHGRVFGQQAAARARNSNRSRRAAQGRFAGSVGTRIQIVGVWVAAGLLLGILASRALAAIALSTQPG